MINENDAAATQKFTVTQGFLTEHSAFFEAACRNGWEEASTRTIRLPDVNNDTFHAYLYWVHKEKIPYETDCDDEGCPVLWHDEARRVLDEIIKLWLLADRLMTAKLRNDAADAILRVLDILHQESDMEEVFPASTIALIWPSTTEGRAIRRIVVDWYAYIVYPESIKAKIEHYHPEFVRELALKALSIIQNPTRDVHPSLERTGHYHELDKPQPRSNIHGNATIEFKDRDGISLQAQRSLFTTPRECIDAVNSAAKCSDFEPEVKIQIKEDSWMVVQERQWDDWLGKVSDNGTSVWQLQLTALNKLAESKHYERVSISIGFDLLKFPEELVQRGLSRIFD